jgi:hypothetical protein
MRALLEHLYPTGAFDAIYLVGGSYGTVQARIVFGALYELFPPGRYIADCILIVGFSTFHFDKGYEKNLNWQNWVSVGPSFRSVLSSGSSE